MPKTPPKKQSQPKSNPPSLNKILTIIVVIITILVAVLLIYLIINAPTYPKKARCLKPTQDLQSNQPMTAGPELDRQVPISGWQTYHNEKYGLEFNYPHNWLLKIQLGGSRAHLRPQAEVASFSLQQEDISRVHGISIHVYSYDILADKLEEIAENKLEPATKIRLTAEDVSLGQINCTQIAMQDIDGLAMKQYYCQNAKYTFLIAPTDFGHPPEAQDQILPTLKFLNDQQTVFRGEVQEDLASWSPLFNRCTTAGYFVEIGGDKYYLTNLCSIFYKDLLQVDPFNKNLVSDRFDLLNKNLLTKTNKITGWKGTKQIEVPSSKTDQMSTNLKEYKIFKVDKIGDNY